MNSTTDANSTATNGTIDEDEEILSNNTESEDKVNNETTSNKTATETDDKKEKAKSDL